MEFRPRALNSFGIIMEKLVTELEPDTDDEGMLAVAKEDDDNSDDEEPAPDAGAASGSHGAPGPQGGAPAPIPLGDEPGPDGGAPKTTHGVLQYDADELKELEGRLFKKPKPINVVTDSRGGAFTFSSVDPFDFCLRGGCSIAGMFAAASTNQKPKVTHWNEPAVDNDIPKANAHTEPEVDNDIPKVTHHPEPKVKKHILKVKPPTEPEVDKHIDPTVHTCKYRITPKFRLTDKVRTFAKKAVKDGILGTKYTLKELQHILEGGKGGPDYDSIAKRSSGDTFAPLPRDYLNMKRDMKEQRKKNGAARKKAKLQKRIKKVARKEATKKIKKEKPKVKPEKEKKPKVKPEKEKKPKVKPEKPEVEPKKPKVKPEKPEGEPKAKPADKVIDPLDGYYFLNGDSHCVVRKRAHSKAYRVEFKRCFDLGYKRIRCLKRARFVSSKEIKRWESVVQP
jgi:hypothetical protein